MVAAIRLQQNGYTGVIFYAKFASLSTDQALRGTWRSLKTGEVSLVCSLHDEHPQTLVKLNHVT